MSEQLALDGTTRDIGVVEHLFPRTKSGALRENPMPSVYGPGPADKRCRDCVHLLVFEQSRRWFKCELRRMSSSVVTDHRATWPTCGKFEQAPESEYA
jgi:hypothetical protein